MRGTELLRLVALNINQNKFKSVMTSIGIVVGAATIVLVFGIGRGGQLDVAEQFAELNAGAIDVSYDYEGEEAGGGGEEFSFGDIGQMFGNIGNMFSNMFGGGGGGDSSGNASGGDSGSSGGGMQMPGGGNFGGGSMPGGDSSGDSSDSDSSSGGGMQMPGGGNFGGGDMPGGDSSGDSSDSDSSSGGNMQMPGSGNFGGGDMPGGNSSDSNSSAGGDMQMPDGESFDGDMPGEEASTEGAQEEESGQDSGESEERESGTGADEEASAETETSMVEDRLNQEEIILTQDDVEDIERYVDGISGVTISYSTKSSVEGANLTSAQTYTVAGVKESYADVSKLVLANGSFILEEDDDTKSRVCVLGATVAKELFGDEDEIVGSTLYIDDRTYEVAGVLEQTSTVSAGISPDTAIFIPYETGIKYITGESISPVITVIAEDVNVLDSVISDVQTVLEENYDNASFTFEDSGSKMEAAQSSNRTLTMLLTAMAVIVFLVGGIGIMNVLFVSVKERTNEIGILKAIGTSRGNILVEFLIESAAISCIGGVLGVGISFGVIPIVERFDVRVEVTPAACLMALGFAVLTGTIFGIYPAWKASRLEPVEALNAE